MTERNKGLIYMWICIIAWGTSFIATKVAVEVIPPIFLGFLRFAIASIILVIFVRKDIKYTKRERINLIFAGFFGITTYFIAENSALSFTTATNTSLIVSSTPIFFLIVNDLVEKKFSSKIRYFGTTIGFIGVTVLILNGTFVLEVNPLGDLIAFGAVFSWILYTLFLEKIKDRDEGIITRDLTMYGTLFFIPFLFLEKNTLPGCPIYQLWLKPSIIISLLFLGIVCSSIAYFLWMKAIKVLGSRTVTSSLFLIPIVTVIADSILLKNFPNVYSLIGATLILLGNYIAERKS